MSMVVNERDVLLQAASVRDTDPRAGKAILLSADAPLFRVDVAGGGLPATISLRAQLVNIKGSVQWTVVGVQGGLNVESDPLVATLAYAQLLADTVEVTASVTENGQQYSAVQRIQRIKEGVQGQSTAQLYAYKRAATAPSDKPGDITYDFAARRITQPSTDALANGWTKTIPAGTDPLYVSVASASGFLAADNVAAAEWSGAVLLAQNGAKGLNTATVFIYQRTASATPPALPGASTTYTFADGALAGLNNGWSRTIPSSGGAFLHISQATAASTEATDTIPAGEWSASLLATDGASGQSQAMVYAYKRAATAPSDDPGPVTFTFAAGAITTPSGNALANGWSKTIPAGTDALYVAAASAVGSGAADSIGAGEWATPVLFSQNGLNGATVYIYQRTTSIGAPPLPTLPATYTFENSALTGLNNGWSTRVPDDIGGDYLYVATATAASAGVSDTIGAGEWAAPQLMAKNGSNAKVISLGATSQIFQVSKTGAASPSSVTVSARAQNLTGSPVWTVVAGTATLSAGANPFEKVISYADLATDYATIQVSCDGQTDKMTVAKVREGSDAVVALLSNESHTLPCDASGIVSSTLGAAATMTLYAGAANVTGLYAFAYSPPASSANISYTSSANTVTVTDMSSSVDSSYIDVTASRPGYPDIVKRFSISKSKAGSKGNTGEAGSAGSPALNTALVTIYFRTSGAPSVPAEPLTYYFGSSSLSGSLAGWSQYVPTGTDPIYISTALVSSYWGAETITMDKWSVPALLAKNGSNGTNGLRGSISAQKSGFASWSDTAASNLIWEKTLSLPRLMDTVTLYGASFSQTKYYDGSAWILLQNYLSGNVLVDGTLAATKLVADSFVGYTFTGNTFRTAASGGRIEIDHAANKFTHYTTAAGVDVPRVIIGGGSGSVYVQSAPGSSPAIFSYVDTIASAVAGVNNNAGGLGYGGKFSHNGADGIALWAAGTTALRLTGRTQVDPLSGNAGQSIFNGIAPAVDISYNCGEGTHRWAAIYSLTGPIQTSDAREKRDIENLSEGLDFIKCLRPVQYRWKESINEVVDDDTFVGPFNENSRPTKVVPRSGTRLHYGFLAQEVKQVLGCKDVGLHILENKADPESRQGLRYDELLAPIVKAIQQLACTVEEQAVAITHLQQKLILLSAD